VQLENWLERKGLHVSSQDKFNQGDSTLWKKLHDEVARFRAVIYIIGAKLAGRRKIASSADQA